MATVIARRTGVACPVGAERLASALPTPSRAGPKAQPPYRVPAAAATVSAGAGPAAQPTMRLAYIQSSAIKLDRLIGDGHRQIVQTTIVQTDTRCAVERTDLGDSFEREGRVYSLLGDIVGELGRALDPVATTHRWLDLASQKLLQIAEP